MLMAKKNLESVAKQAPAKKAPKQTTAPKQAVKTAATSKKDDCCSSSDDQACCGAHDCCSHDAVKKTVAPKKGKPGVAGDGSKVTVHYTGTFADGTVFDSSEGREPLPFTIGGRQVVRGFEQAVSGMKVGEKKKVTLAPKDAYGDRNPQMVQEVPIEAVTKAGITPEKGMMLVLSHPQQPGMQLPAQIVDVTEKTVKIDLNHPLAGKELCFKIELVNVE
jgi:peptidylprolyl isomerase